MKTVSLTLAAIFALSGSVASAQPAPATPASTAAQPSQASLAVARQIIDIAYPPAQRPALFASVMQSMLQQMKSSMLPGISDPGLRQLLSNKIDTMPARLGPVTQKHIPAFMESYAHAYAREFSAAELRQLLAFVSTPAGSHYVSRAAYLLSDPDVSAANRAYFADVQLLQGVIMAETTREVAEYVAKHPEAAPKAPPPE